MSETTEPAVELMGETIQYTVRQSEEATQARIDVDMRGVRVIVPEGSSADPESLLTEKANWVVEKKRKFDEYREEAPERTYEPGAEFPYLDELHEVVVESRSSSVIEDGIIRLAEHHVEDTSVKRALETLYRRKARERFEARADHFASEMEVEYEKIEIRNQRTKWGSCSTTGTLGLNWRLMMAPEAVIDYVIVHELAHLQESNHTDDFWNIVADYDPEYQDHAEWLQDNSTQLIFSEEDL